MPSSVRPPGTPARPRGCLERERHTVPPTSHHTPLMSARPAPPLLSICGWSVCRCWPYLPTDPFHVREQHPERHEVPLVELVHGAAREPACTHRPPPRLTTLSPPPFPPAACLPACPSEHERTRAGLAASARAPVGGATWTARRRPSTGSTWTATAPPATTTHIHTRTGPCPSSSKLEGGVRQQDSPTSLPTCSRRSSGMTARLPSVPSFFSLTTTTTAHHPD